MVAARVLLSYVIAPVEDSATLAEVCRLRASAYSHYLGELGQLFGEPDAIDAQSDTHVYAARAKADGRVLGSIRVTINAEAKLPLEESAALPAETSRLRLAEFTRLVVARDGADASLVAMLMKTAYLDAVERHVAMLVVASREKMALRYEALGFRDVEQGRWYPLAHAGGLDHRVLALDLRDIEARYRGVNPGMFAAVIETDHPDIQVVRKTRPSAARQIAS
jgi:hypothetical protein